MNLTRFVVLALCFLLALSNTPMAWAQYSDSDLPLEPGGIPTPIMDEVKMGNLDAYAFIPFVDEYGRLYDVTIYFGSNTARVTGAGLDQTTSIPPELAQSIKVLVGAYRDGHFKCGAVCVGLVVAIVLTVVSLGSDYYLDQNACRNMINNARNQYISSGISCVSQQSYRNSSGKVCSYKWVSLSDSANVMLGECTVQSGACVVECN